MSKSVQKVLLAVLTAIIVALLITIVVLAVQLNEYKSQNKPTDIVMEVLNPYSDDIIEDSGKIRVPSGEEFKGLEIKYRKKNTKYYYPDNKIKQDDLDYYTDISYKKGSALIEIYNWDEFPKEKGIYEIVIKFGFETNKYANHTINIILVIQ